MTDAGDAAAGRISRLQRCVESKTDRRQQSARGVEMPVTMEQQQQQQQQQPGAAPARDRRTAVGWRCCCRRRHWQRRRAASGSRAATNAADDGSEIGRVPTPISPSAAVDPVRSQRRPIPPSLCRPRQRVRSIAVSIGRV